jgi:hypothetical protein
MRCRIGRRLVDLATEGEKQMMRRKTAQIAALISMVSSTTAWAQSPKELKTKVGVPVVLVNLLNARPDCSTNPGPVAVPIVSGRPANGVIQMQIIVSDVAASSKCPARKIPSTALIYAPNKEFTGSDAVRIDVEVGNQKQSLSYRISVQAVGQQL